MSAQTKHGIFGLLVAITVSALTLPSGPAEAAVAGVNGVKLLGNADFGRGSHVGGGPVDQASITWDYSPVNGETIVSARVVGLLYLDDGDDGCARIQIFFRDASDNNLSSLTRSFCGPGGNANLSANILLIDENFASPGLHKVVIVTAHKPNLGIGFFFEQDIEAFLAPEISILDTINNGSTDFGNLPHIGGGPWNPYSIELAKSVTRGLGGNVIWGRVIGRLFWDDLFSAGTTRLIVDFKDANGNNLAQRVIDLRGDGGNAGGPDNNAAMTQEFSSPSLFKIRVRVGRLSGGSFVNVSSRTYSFGPQVGTVAGIPENAFAKVGEDMNYGIQWTVPDPASWRSLDIMDVVLFDEEGEILQVRWDEAANSFTQLAGHSEFAGIREWPGIRMVFQSSAVSMFLKDTQVIGSGPTGSSVLLNLHLRFKPQAAGRTFSVLVVARDDEGSVQQEVAGTISVLPSNSPQEQ
jgi:hypothetical protein